MASSAEYPNMVSAPRFHRRIAPSRSAKITASGISSTIRRNSQPGDLVFIGGSLLGALISHDG
jgi:hypothetical protein